MFPSAKRLAERRRIQEQEAETKRVCDILDAHLVAIKTRIKGCVNATVALTFDGNTGPVIYGGADIDKLLYALKELKRDGKPIDQHFAERYAEVGGKPAPVVAFGTPVRHTDWMYNYTKGAFDLVSSMPPSQPKKPDVSRTSSKFRGRLLKVSSVERQARPWSDGKPRLKLKGFAADDPKFNGHPTTTDFIVDDYTVAGTRFVIDASNQRWEILS